MPPTRIGPIGCASLNDHMRLSIELALTAADTDPVQRDRQDAESRLLGMSGAEIDAARSGRSFDALTALVLAMATAMHGADPVGIRQAKARARKAGLPETLLDEIESIVSRWKPVGPDRP